MKIIKIIKQHLCRHDWGIGRMGSVYGFESLRGEQLYRRCKKCGKIEKWIYREYEGLGYK